MAKRQRRSLLVADQGQAGASGASAAAASGSGVPTAPVAAPPSSTVRSLLTVWLVAHGFLLLVAYSSAIQPSAVQGRLLGFFSWYLNAMHLSLDGRPIYLAHGGWSEAAHQFQTRRQPAAGGTADDALPWQSLDTPGWVGGERRKRYQRWAKATATLAQQQLPGLAGLLARRAVTAPDAQGLRIVQLENPSIPPSLEPVEPPYEAAVVREGDQLRFVQLAPPRQNALPTADAETAVASPNAASPDVDVPPAAGTAPANGAEEAGQ